MQYLDLQEGIRGILSLGQLTFFAARSVLLTLFRGPYQSQMCAMQGVRQPRPRSAPSI